MLTSIILYQNGKMVLFFFKRNGVNQECCCQWDKTFPFTSLYYSSLSESSEPLNV